jgi:hypothetical protein
MNTRHLVILALASNLMGCQLIKKFTDRNRDSGAAQTGTTVVTLDGGMALPAEYDAGAAANAAIAAANAAMANGADASAQANQAIQNAQNALADAAPGAAVVVPTAALDGDAGGAPAQPGVAPTAAPEPAAPPPVVAAPSSPPPPVAEPAAPAPTAAEPEPAGRPSRHHGSGNYCARHPGQLDPRTGQICPNVLGSQNLQR